MSTDIFRETLLVFPLGIYLDYLSHNFPKIQYTLANPNRDVPIQKISVPITEFVRISEVVLIIWKINNIKICDNPLLLV